MAKTEQKKDIFKTIILEGMKEMLISEMGYSENSFKNINDINNLDNKTKGKAFLLFYLNKIFKDFYRIDDDLIQSGIIDNAGDKGIDFIAIDDNKIYIVQTKYNYKKNNEIEDFLNIPHNIKTNFYQNTANADLKEFISEIKKIKNPEFVLLYVTTAQANEEEEKHFEERAKANNVQFSLVDFSSLRLEHETVSTMGENPPDNISLNLGQEDFIELTVEPNETILITQKGSKLKSLYLRSDCRERLFNYNIRQWLGKNSVNKGMIETIETEPNKFFYYNNGITAICEDYKIDNEKNIIICSKFQIVNGAQTLTTLAKSDSTNLSKIKVLLKIVKADKYTTGDKDNSLAANIVKNNNSQTVIKAIDFRSNDLIQVDIDKKVKDNKLKYPLDYPMSQPVAYKRKRRLNESKYKTIAMENIAKTYYSMFINPSDIYLSSKKLWDTTENGYYYKIFGHNGEKVDSITDEEFYKLFGSYYIYTYVDLKIKSILTKYENKEDYPPFYFKYHIVWGIHKLLTIKYDNYQISRIFKQIVDRGYFINEKIHSNKASAFSLYYDKIVKFISTEVKRIKDQTDNVAYRRLLVGNDFLQALKYRIDEIEKCELPDLIDETH